MTEKFTTIFNKFSNLLFERLKSGKYTEEDTIRYLFFYSCTQNGIAPNDFTLEKHVFPDEPKAELDTFIEENNERPSVAVEFKYDRNPENKSNNARTVQAGEIVKDLRRLTQISKADRKLFVYVTDDEMRNYFENQTDWRASLSDFFNLGEGEEKQIKVSETAPASFKNKAGEFSSCIAKNLFSHSFDGTSLHIYEIKNNR